MTLELVVNKTKKNQNNYQTRVTSNQAFADTLVNSIITASKQSLGIKGESINKTSLLDELNVLKDGLDKLECIKRGVIGLALARQIPNLTQEADLNKLDSLLTKRSVLEYLMGKGLLHLITPEDLIKIDNLNRVIKNLKHSINNSSKMDESAKECFTDLLGDKAYLERLLNKAVVRAGIESSLRTVKLSLVR